MIANIIGCRDADGKGGLFNYGGYCNREIEALNKKILEETDIAKRDAMIAEAYRINHEEAGVIPLHQQALVGASRTRSISSSAPTTRSCSTGRG